MIEKNKLYTGDAANILKQFPNNIIDMIITSRISLQGSPRVSTVGGIATTFY